MQCFVMSYLKVSFPSSPSYHYIDERRPRSWRTDLQASGFTVISHFILFYRRKHQFQSSLSSWLLWVLSSETSIWSYRDQQTHHLDHPHLHILTSKWKKSQSLQSAFRSLKQWPSQSGFRNLIQLPSDHQDGD